MQKSHQLASNIEPRITMQDDFVLRHLLKDYFHKNGCAVEIGSFLGHGSTQTILEGIRDANGTLYCVDTWKGNRNVAWHLKLAEEYDLFATFMHNITMAGGCGIVKPMMMESKDAARIFKDKSCDLIFIDSDHSFEATLQDIEMWMPKVRPGGILCGHDCEGSPQDFDPEVIAKNLKEDFVPLNNFTFAGFHPGVVKAVSSIAKDVTFWAHQDLAPHGISGRSSIWHLTL